MSPKTSIHVPHFHYGYHFRDIVEQSLPDFNQFYQGQIESILQKCRLSFGRRCTLAYVPNVQHSITWNGRKKNKHEQHLITHDFPHLNFLLSSPYTHDSLLLFRNFDSFVAGIYNQYYYFSLMYVTFYITWKIAWVHVQCAMCIQIKCILKNVGNWCCYRCCCCSRNVILISQLKWMFFRIIIILISPQGCTYLAWKTLHE